MSKPVKVARKVGVLFVGIPVIIVGIALLVLPGPGIVVIIAGLLILSLEFEFAKKYVEILRAKTKSATNAVRKRTSKTGEARKKSDE